MTNLTLLNIEANTASFKWLEPCYINDNSAYYSIKIINNTRSERENTRFEINVSTTTLHTEVTDLLPFRNYTLQITPVNSAGAGRHVEHSFQTHISGRTFLDISL